MRDTALHLSLRGAQRRDDLDASGYQCTDVASSPTCCGDTLCEGNEDGFSCAVDCGAPPVDETGLCEDGFDNDGDGRADCSESDCATDPACIVSCSDPASLSAVMENFVPVIAAANIQRSV